MTTSRGPAYHSKGNYVVCKFCYQGDHVHCRVEWTYKLREEAAGARYVCDCPCRRARGDAKCNTGSRTKN